MGLSLYSTFNRAFISDYTLICKKDLPFRFIFWRMRGHLSDLFEFLWWNGQPYIHQEQSVHSQSHISVLLGNG